MKQLGLALISRVIRLQLLGTLCVFFVSVAALRAEIPQATDAPPPKTPEESARCIQLPPGFRIELVASEPMILEPSGVAFDEQGRLFVSEIHGYNVDGYLDIVELNKTGVLDREVRRVRHATEESQREAAKQTYGTVRLLRDTDGDGRMDTSSVFADRLPPCYGVVPARGGVVAVGAPDITFLADRDGDGEAEVREVLFTGFRRELIERGTGNPRLGPDNWIYCAAGGGGGEITGPNLPQPVQIGHTDYRFRPDGSAIEPVTGTETMFGLTMTDFGDRFHTIMTFVTPVEYRYLARNPFIPSPDTGVGIIPSRQLFPISRPDPWRLARGSDPAWIRFYGETETTPNGFFTASSGQMIYRAAMLPAEYRDNYFVCDPANNLIHRELLERDGDSYRGRRPDAETDREFLASSDQWFRPINLTIGPDGAIYITDMYREIVEDFSAIPRFLQQQYMQSLINGHEHGRIWRLSWADDNTETAPADEPHTLKQAAQLASASTAELVDRLHHSNHWWRDAAQRLLIERNDRSAVPLLANAVRSGASEQCRLHALYALEGLESLTADVVRQALADPSWGVRMHALQLAEQSLDDDDILNHAQQLASDADPRVRLQAALSIGESRNPRALAELAELAAKHGDERWIAAAISSSSAETAEQLIDKLVAGPPGAGALAVLSPLAETIGARRDDAQLGATLESAERAQEPAARLVVLQGLIAGLERSESRELKSDAGLAAIEKLLQEPSPEVSQRAVRIAGLVKLHQSPIMEAAWKSAIETALNPERAVEDRYNAVALLGVAPWDRKLLLQGLLDAREPVPLQLAAIDAFSGDDHPDAAANLLSNWSGLSPAVQDAVIDALFSRQERLPTLLDAIEHGALAAASLSALRREQLSEHGTAAIRERARKLLETAGTSDRAPIVAHYESALALERDPQRGSQVFQKSCARCHALAGKGSNVGPDLSGARTRADATLIVDLFDPSSNLAHGFTVYAVETAEGRVHTGLLATETATSITLRTAREAGATAEQPIVETVILRKGIAAMRASTKSLMPDGLEKELSPQDVADLIGFLRESLGPVAPQGIVLFDDEPEFLQSLDSGSASATLSDDAHSGHASLLLTTGQRFSPQIAGWEFRIVENPAAAEPRVDPAIPDSSQASRRYRYLRFQWKSKGATGVMLELAANGAWPPADRALRRYYSGTNSTRWQAIELSPDAPVEWTTVTVDLWKDAGPFVLTGIAPTALEGDALFDRFELLETLDSPPQTEK